MRHSIGKKSHRNRIFVFGTATDDFSEAQLSRWQPFVDGLFRQARWTESPHLTLFVDFQFTLRELAALIFLHRTNLKVLIKVEPLSVNPVQYTKFLSRFFDYIICEQGNSQKGFCDDVWQAGFDFTEYRHSAKTTSLGCLIGNKKSFVAGSLYHKRVEVIERLIHLGLEIEIGGRGWDESWIKSFIRGCLELLKALVSQVGLRPGWSDGLLLREPKPSGIREVAQVEAFWANKDAALIIENEGNLVSEKIFDALSQNCRLIYWGAKLPNSPCIMEIDDNVSYVAVRKFLDMPRPSEDKFIQLRAEISEVIPTTLDSFGMLVDKVLQIKDKGLERKLIQ